MSGPVPSEATLLTALGNFIQQVALPGIVVVQGQQSRVAEPQASDFVVMTPILRARLATNFDSYADASFDASISGNALTVTAMLLGAIALGSTLFGTNVAGAPQITAQQSGAPGGVGVYTISGAPQSLASEKMAAGNELLTARTKVSVQLDVHSAALTTAGDNAQTLTTLLRDDVAQVWFAANYPGVAPLHADDPKQMPFLNAEEQWETRYVVTAEMQVNAALTLSQQFADQLQATLKPIEVVAPHP